MHKDPPPTLLEKSIPEIVIHGLITGIVISVVVFGVWALFAQDNRVDPRPPLPIPSGK